MANEVYSVEGPHTNEMGSNSRGRGREAVADDLAKVFDRVKAAGGKLVAEIMFTTPVGAQPNIAGTQPAAGVEILFLVVDRDEAQDTSST